MCLHVDNVLTFSVDGDVDDKVSATQHGGSRN